LHQAYTNDTNAAPAAYHRKVSGGHSMPSRRNDQEQFIDEQLVNEQCADEQLADELSVDAIAMLKEDHQRVKDLFAQYEGTSNAEAKWTLAEEVFVELETHAQLEESIFYPSVNEETEAYPIVKTKKSEN
jgi:hypothetical protein